MSSSTSFTYTSLVAAIQAWTTDEGSELSTNIQTIIKLGESRAATDLNINVFDRSISAAMSSGQVLQSKPVNWQGTRSITYRSAADTGPHEYMQPRSLQFCLDYQKDPTITGSPLYYADFNETQWYFAPAPSTALMMYAVVIQPVTGLTSVNPNTWLSNQQGDLLLYACLLSTEEFLKSEPEYLQKWGEEYSRLVEIRRLELRRSLREDYTPVRNAARTVEQQP